MAKKQSIQTQLLGIEVVVGEETGTRWGPPQSAVGKTGKIVNIYYDQDGDLKYTILIFETGKLVELYPNSFTILYPEE